jgi:Molecular chaperone GrpE (heat shock protein)
MTEEQKKKTTMGNEETVAEETEKKQETAEETETCRESGSEAEAEAGEAEEAKTEEKAKAEEAKATEKAEDEGLNTKYLRLMADFQNYKRRTEKEKNDIYSYANEKLVAQLLDVMDSFERALGHECTDAGYAEGMKMIFKQLSDVLEKSGLEEIKALGEDFDPNFHNAVMTEDNDEFESGKVTAVMQKGYMLNNKLIRPSMVKVNN